MRLFIPTGSSLRRGAVLVLLLLGVGVVGLPAAVLAQYTPPDRGLPGRREGGGTRGDRTACVQGERSLVALIPETVFGTTVASAPVLHWYVPQVNAATLEFSMYDAEGNTVVLLDMPPPNAAGIVSLKLPASAGELALNADYHWYFSIVCNAADRSADVFTEGWVRRVPLTAELDAQLQAAPADQQAAIYAEAGLWYDALTATVQQRCQNTGDATAAQWAELLDSVGLRSLADAPLAAACAGASLPDSAE